MSSHQNTHKTENSFLVGQKKNDVLSASGTKKVSFTWAESKTKKLIVNLALVR